MRFLSKTPGTGGQLKASAEDFVVQEIGQSAGKEATEGGYTAFLLEKRNWNTTQAITAIAKQLRISPKRFSYSGVKDRTAATSQQISIAGQVDLSKVHLKDISISEVRKADAAVSLGSHSGNQFRITVRGIGAGAEKKVAKICTELKKKAEPFSPGSVIAVPSYFGEQRFGTTRQNTARVGELLVAGRLKDAALEYLVGGEREKNKDAREARAALTSHGDFDLALREFPSYLKFERTLLGHLARQPRDFAGAFRRLPRGLALMFVHAHQSLLFNEVLSERLSAGARLQAGEYKCATDSAGFPDLEKRVESGWTVGRIVGHETSELSELEKEVFERHEMTPAAFRLRELPELSAKGAPRSLLVPLVNFKFDQTGEAGVFEFSLPSGAYATAALREFTSETK